MENLQIDSGEKRIAINGDESRVIVFNPKDATFAEKFYTFMTQMQNRVDAYEAKAKAIDANSAIDASGIPVNFLQRTEFMKELHIEVCQGIDNIFGPDSSQKVFGNMIPVDDAVYQQFFKGIIPYIEAERRAKIEKYTNKRPRRK